MQVKMQPEEEMPKAQEPQQQAVEQVVDRYPLSTHANNSIMMYGVPAHEIAGAIAYGQQKYPDKYQSGTFSKDEVLALHSEFLAQEHQGEKQLIEERGY